MSEMTDKKPLPPWGQVARERAMYCEELGRTRAALDSLLGVDLVGCPDWSTIQKQIFLKERINQLQKTVFDLGTTTRAIHDRERSETNEYREDFRQLQAAFDNKLTENAELTKQVKTFSEVVTKLKRKLDELEKKDTPDAEEAASETQSDAKAVEISKSSC